MKSVFIDPTEFPRLPGESWWVVHPNSAGAQFCIPVGAVTPCIKDFKEFKEGVVYSIAEGQKGWVVVTVNSTPYHMPQYLFARHFDAEAFVIGSATLEEIANAKPFDGNPTVPKKPKKQLELFEDSD